MKKLSFVLIALAGLIVCSISRANITGIYWWDDGSGAIICSSTNWNSADSVLSMAGSQSGPGQMNGWVKTDSPDDPTLTLSGAVDNDTGFAWTSYQVNVYMSVLFSFVAPGPSVDNPAPDTPPDDNWFVSGVVAPAWNGSQYEGTLYFSAGTPVNIGDELDFTYSIHFASATQYSFTQEMIPVPEPGAFGLMMVGGFALGGLAWKRRGNRST